MGPFWVAGDRLESETCVELYSPMRHLKTMSRDREFGKGYTAPCAPDDDATTILRRSICSRLQDIEAGLIAIPKR